MHLWQHLQPQVFLKMMKQAWHAYLWADSPIPLCGTSQVPSGWMGRVGTQPFLSRDVQFNSSLKDTHTVVLKPLCWYLGFELRVAVVVKRWTVAPKVKSVLEHVFIQEVSLRCCIVPSVLTSLPGSYCLRQSLWLCCTRHFLVFHF